MPELGSRPWSVWAAFILSCCSLSLRRYSHCEKERMFIETNGNIDLLTDTFWSLLNILRAVMIGSYWKPISFNDRIALRRKEAVAFKAIRRGLLWYWAENAADEILAATRKDHSGRIEDFECVPSQQIDEISIARMDSWRYVPVSDDRRSFHRRDQRLRSRWCLVALGVVPSLHEDRV